jgi:Fe-S cluster biogenesis protein NfuA
MPDVTTGVAEPALAELVGALARLEGEVETWAAAPRDTVRAYREAIDALHAAALRRLVRRLKGDPAAAAALREAAADEIVYAVLRHHGIVKPSLFERVEAALAGIRPMLAGHGGDVELVHVDPPVATIRLTGSCDTCAASSLTIAAAIKAAVRAACPQITEIVPDKVASAGRPAR